MSRYLLVLALVLGAPAAAMDEEAASITCDPAEADCGEFESAQSVEQAFLNLQIAIGMLGERTEYDSDLSSAAATSIQAQVNELQGMFISPGGSSEADPEYVQALNLSANALVLAVQQPDANIANAELDVFQRDLQLKLSSARATMGAQGVVPKTISATIIPKRNGVPVTGLRIKLAEGLRMAYPPTIVFGQLSNPGATERITPGVYKVYAYQGDVLVGVEVLDIAIAGETSVTLDLQVK